MLFLGIVFCGYVFFLIFFVFGLNVLLCFGFLWLHYGKNGLFWVSWIASLVLIPSSVSAARLACVAAAIAPPKLNRGRRGHLRGPIPKM